MTNNSRKTAPGVRPQMLILSLLFFAANAAFGRGKTQEPEKPVLNNEWILCVTGFDYSALPENRRAVGETFTKSLVDSLKEVSSRIRISPEYAYYEGYAWSQARAAAAKALNAKQEERALALYRGDPNWKYRQDVKKIDAEIVKLREEFDKTEAEMPLINQEPVFGITQGNKDGTYPEAPAAGGERRFCQGQQSDAFLAGSIREYHGRCYVTMRLYALYTHSFIYEDEIIFSPDDLAGAVDEIAGRLTAALSGDKPAAIAVYTEPADTLVLINRSFAGRGTVEARDFPQGTVSVQLSAQDHVPETVETRLTPGELAEINAALLPQEYGEVNIAVPGSGARARVYQGALYVGEAPLTLRLPLSQLDYLSVETDDERSARIAYVSPADAGTPYAFSLKPKTLPPSGRVDKARRRYYWGWGGTWIAGIAAWLITGISNTQTLGLIEGVASRNVYHESFRDDSVRIYRISQGAWAVLGVVVAHEIFQMARYIYTATEDTTPVAKPGK